MKCVKCVMSAKAAGPGGGGGAGRSGIQNQKQEPHTEMSCHTKNDGRCDQVPRQVPRLPRETTVDVVKCHACHAKRGWMSCSATPATQSDGCRQVPRLPCKVPRRHRATSSAQAAPTRRPSAPPAQPSARSATLATQSESGCREVPRLPKTVCGRWCVTKLCVKDGV